MTKYTAVLVLALVAFGQLAAAQTCPAAPWRSLPLAKKPATLAQLDISDWQGYIRGSLVPHIVGAAVALVIALILLLTYLSWRLVKCCVCCKCVRGPQREGNKARKLLAGKGAHRLKAAALLAAAGVLAGGIYGVTKVDSNMVDPGLTAIGTVTTFIDHALTAGTDTVAAAQALDAQLHVVRDELAAQGPSTASYVQAIDDARSSISSITGMSGDLTTIRTHTVDKIDSTISAHESTAHTADKWRAIGLFIAYGVLAGLAVVAVFAVLIDWPAALKPLLLAFLLLMLLAWLIVLVLTATLRVGNDVCVNVEAKALDLVSNSNSFSIGSGGGGAAALVQYYLYGTGDSVLSVVNSTLGIDVEASLDQANSTLTDLQDAVDSNPSFAPMSDDVALLVTLFNNVSASVDALTLALSYASFHPVWLEVKGYICCTLLNSVGATWLALIIASSFGLALVVAAFAWIGRMDKLRSLGCCHIYSARDYSLEGEGRHSSDQEQHHHSHQHAHLDGDGYEGPLAHADHLKKKAGPSELSVPASPIMARKDGWQPGQQLPPSPPGSSGSHRSNRVTPAFHSMTTGEPVPAAAPETSPFAYPAVANDYGAPGSPGSGAFGHPPPAAGYPNPYPNGSYPPSATGAPPMPDEAELRAEAERAALLAGRAYSMATQAQNLLNVIARTASNASSQGRLSERSPHGSPLAGGSPSSPPSWGAPLPPYSGAGGYPAPHA